RRDADIAAGKVGPIRSVVPVAVQLGAGQDVERTFAVVAKNRSELKTLKDPRESSGAVRRLQDGVSDHRVPRADGRPLAVTAPAGLVVRLKVAIVIGSLVHGLAEGVIEGQAEIAGEAFIHFQDHSVVPGVRARFVIVLLVEKRIAKVLRAG